MTKEDEKCYWGKISYMNDGSTTSKGETSFTTKDSSEVTTPDNDDNNTPRLSVEGSVIFGYGLEPLPVARFVMTETTATGEDENLDDDDDDDDDEDHDNDDDDRNEPKDEFLDWSNAFQ